MAEVSKFIIDHKFFIFWVESQITDDFKQKLICTHMLVQRRREGGRERERERERERGRESTQVHV